MKLTNGGLESLALALILAPDPVTTVVGIGLLAYAKCAKMSNNVAATAPARRRASDRFEDIYAYNISIKDGKALSYKLSSKREGQLPLARQNSGSMYSSNIALNVYHRKEAADVRTKKAVITGQQPPGLLARPQVTNPPGRHVTVKEERVKREVITGQQPPGLLNRPQVMNHTKFTEPARPGRKIRKP